MIDDLIMLLIGWAMFKGLVIGMLEQIFEDEEEIEDVEPIRKFEIVQRKQNGKWVEVEREKK